MKDPVALLRGLDLCPDICGRACRLHCFFSCSLYSLYGRGIYHWLGHSFVFSQVWQTCLAQLQILCVRLQNAYMDTEIFETGAIGNFISRTAGKHSMNKPVLLVLDDFGPQVY